MNFLMYLITGIGLSGKVRRASSNYWHEPEAEVYVDMALALVEARNGKRWVRALLSHVGVAR